MIEAKKPKIEEKKPSFAKTVEGKEEFESKLWIWREWLIRGLAEKN